MKARRLIGLLRGWIGKPDAIEIRSRAAAAQFDAQSNTGREPYLLWLGGFVAVVVVVATVASARTHSRLGLVASPLPLLAEAVTVYTKPQADRTDCAAIGGSDLRSPLEGLWFQGNCVSMPQPPLQPILTNCNRTSLDPVDFSSVAPSLYVFRRTPGSDAALWYASSDVCFDLVSTRIVTAVCADQTVTFNWNMRTGCAAHGGILAVVNGR